MGSHFPRADKTGCILCHGEDGAAYLADWKSRLSPAMASASAALAKAETVLKNKPAAEQILADARYNISLVIKGRGVHNIEYSLKILESAEGMIGKAYAEK